jgi:hypothetical protein
VKKISSKQQHVCRRNGGEVGGWRDRQSVQRLENAYKGWVFRHSIRSKISGGVEFVVVWVYHANAAKNICLRDKLNFCKWRLSHWRLVARWGCV